MSPSITDWMMVGITAIYVVATAFICWANIKSANAAKEQVALSKIQFEETRRVELMPLLQISVLRNRPVMEVPDISLLLSNDDWCETCFVTDLELYIENIGLGTAKDIHYTWKNLSGINQRYDFPIGALCPQSTCQCYIDICASKNLLSKTPDVYAEIVISYSDLLNNLYTQKITLNFSFDIQSDEFNLKSSKVFAAEYIKESSDA